MTDNQDIIFRSDFDVDLVDFAGSDQMICRAARVSTLGAESIDSKESSGLINFLMANRHGTPFEHSMLTFRITAPIFVWREFMRHRIGISYNEESGRYKELDPMFYIPSSERRLVQVGKPGHYTFEFGNTDQQVLVSDVLKESCRDAWMSYQCLLSNGIAKEVARMCLPLNIYSTAYVTKNPRSLMHFLSLRTKYEDSFFPSFPMHEINQVANQMEAIFARRFPITHQAFNNARRVAP